MEMPSKETRRKTEIESLEKKNAKRKFKIPCVKKEVQLKQKKSKNSKT